MAYLIFKNNKYRGKSRVIVLENGLTLTCSENVKISLRQKWVGNKAIYYHSEIKTCLTLTRETLEICSVRLGYFRTLRYKTKIKYFKYFLGYKVIQIQFRGLFKLKLIKVS
jgi:hypothetical protein